MYDMKEKQTIQFLRNREIVKQNVRQFCWRLALGKTTETSSSSDSFFEEIILGGRE